MSSSFHIELNELYRSIFISNSSITTDPNLNVISCGRRQCYVEPWWWVEGTTGASGTTPLSIPQRVTIWPESKSTSIPLSYAWLTEVVLAHKGGNKVSISATTDAGTQTYRGTRVLFKTTCKAPDVLAGRTICHAHSIKIATVNWPTRTTKCIWGAYLVANHPPTHLVILLTTSGVSESLTASTGRSSPTHPVWGGDLLPHRGTLLGGVGHVEVGCTSPASWPTTGETQERYYCLNEHTLCSIFDLPPCYLLLLLRGAGLAAISLQHFGRVGEREGGAGYFGNSWLS